MENMLSFFTHIDVLLLIFCRLIFAISIIPIVVETKLPVAARVGLSVVLTGIVFYTIPVTTLTYEPTTLSFFLLIIKEMIVGLILGFGILMFFQVYFFVGHLLSMQGGLGMSNLFDPASGSQVPLLGKFYYLAFCAVFVMTGGYHWFIRALVESFMTIPPGMSVFSTSLLGSAVEAMAVFWELSFKLAAPIVGIIFIVDCGLGILARTVPQMNMFVIGLPLKVIILFVLMLFTMQLMPIYNDIIINHIVDLFNSFVEGLKP